MVSIHFTTNLRSPCCFSPLDYHAIQMVNTIILHGEVVCQSCKRRFQIVNGVWYLTLINVCWDVILQELISRRNITEKNMTVPPPEDLEGRKQEQDFVAGDIMTRLFEEALQRVKPRSSWSILDVGAGECKTTRQLAQISSGTCAADADPSGLHFINFKIFGLPEPNVRSVNRRTYYEYAPEGLDAYFNRVVAPAQCLPFASNSFDMVICRSTIHHLENPGVAIAEMDRVVRPGGTVVFCSEPIRSILDSEQYYLEGVVDKEEGLNERCPHILQYLIPLLRDNMKVTVQYWRRPPAPRTRKCIEMLPISWDSHFRDGELAAGKKLLKLLLSAASINVYGIKQKPTPDIMPPYWDTEELASIEPIIDVYGRRDWEGIWNKWIPDTEMLKETRRKILAAKDFALQSFKPCSMRVYDLWQGWGQKTVIDGKSARRMHSLGLLTLKVPDSAQSIEIIYHLKNPARPEVLSVRLNHITTGEYRLVNGGWKSLRIALPELKEHIIDIMLKIKNSDGETDSPELYIHKIRVLA